MGSALSGIFVFCLGEGRHQEITGGSGHALSGPRGAKGHPLVSQELAKVLAFSTWGTLFPQLVDFSMAC